MLTTIIKFIILFIAVYALIKNLKWVLLIAAILFLFFALGNYLHYNPMTFIQEIINVNP